MAKHSKKLLLIGWDGADWKTINPLIDQGLLPNLEKLVNQGTIGNLATLDPAYSPMLWSSIGTGKRPYKHGVLGFNEPVPSSEEEIRPVLSLSRKCKAIWNILTQEGYKTHLVGWWPSHPAEPINGVAISNFFQRATTASADNWELTPNAVHPMEAAAHFAQFRIHPQEITGNHLFPFIPNINELGSHFSQHITQLVRIIAENSSLQAAFTNIIRTREWDFASVYFDGIDRTCHEFMRYHPPKRPHIPQDEFDLFKDVIVGMYRFHDMMLGRLVELAGEEATIILVSDHGFQPDHLRPRNIPYEPAGIAYEHSPYGIFLAKGKGIKQDSLVYGASLLDITPTILHHFDLPIGRDMDGMPLLSIYENPNVPKHIASWEEVVGESGMPKAAFLNNKGALDDMMQQLIDLGYIDPPSNNKKEAHLQTKRFCDLNLARAYFDGGKIVEAKEIFEQLQFKQPNVPWIKFRLATCYQMLGEHPKCRQLIEELKQSHFYQEDMLTTMEVSLLIGEQSYQTAIDLLEKLLQKGTVKHAQVYMQAARCYSMLGQPQKTKAATEKALDLDYDNPIAHEFLGVWNYNNQYYDAAVDCFLNALGLDYNLATTHYYMGRTLLALGKYEEAASAFEVTLEMMPHNNHARQQLAYLLKTHLGKPAASVRVMQEFGKYLQGEMVVVSGLPRSGTSMMMQMLQAGGLPSFTDEKRVADENNPKGYYEHQIVKKLPHNKHWLRSANGKVVKIIAPLITHLPFNYKYKVIFMLRNPHEIYNSQERMLQRLGKREKTGTFSIALLDSLKKTVQESRLWLDKHPSVEVIYVAYEEVLKAPLEYAIKISNFLGGSVQPMEMIKPIDNRLYREKIES
ncbi:MAG: alkaline phosphatase family protein [Bacteroidota bacterium]